MSEQTSFDQITTAIQRAEDGASAAELDAISQALASNHARARPEDLPAAAAWVIGRIRVARDRLRDGLLIATEGSSTADELSKAALNESRHAEESCRVPLLFIARIDSLESAVVLEHIGTHTETTMNPMRSWLLCALAHLPRADLGGARAMLSLVRRFVSEDPDAANLLHWEDVLRVAQLDHEQGPGVALALAMQHERLPNLRWELARVLSAKAGDQRWAPLFVTLRDTILARLEQLELALREALIAKEGVRRAEEAWAILLETLSFADEGDKYAERALQAALEQSASTLVYTAACNVLVRRGRDVPSGALERMAADGDCKAFFASACVRADRADLIADWE